MDVQAVLQAVDAVEAEEDDENTHPLSEEELRKEIKEAFDHIREVGREDGIAMRNKINNEFIKVQGTDARPEQITSVLSKVKDEFLREAREEVLDGLDENDTEEVQFSSAAGWSHGKQ